MLGIGLPALCGRIVTVSSFTLLTDLGIIDEGNEQLEELDKEEILIDTSSLVEDFKQSVNCIVEASRG